MSTTIDAIREVADLLQLAMETVTLHRSGFRFVGCCPFHEEKTPSLTVDPRNGLWYCFGCQKGGDVFTWVMERERVTFAEALHYLCQRYGISTPKWTPQQQAEYELGREVERLLAEIVCRASQLYVNSRGAEYLRERGVDDIVAHAWSVGYADKPSQFGDVLASYPTEVVKAAGVTPSVLDRRIVIPMVKGGRVISLYGRSVRDSSEYRSREDHEADKHRYLTGRPRVPFGLDQHGDEVVVVEAAIDAMSVTVAGRTAIALGGVPTDEQRELLLRHTNGTLYLGLDADDDVSKGPLANLNTAALLYLGPQGRRCYVVDWALGGGKDANEVLVKSGPETVATIIAQARSPLIYRHDKDLDNRCEAPLLVQDGSVLRADFDEHSYTLDAIDNTSDSKGIRANVQLLRHDTVMSVDNIGLWSQLMRRRFIRSNFPRYRDADPSIDLTALQAKMEAELLVLEQELRRWDVARKARAEGQKANTRQPLTDKERAEALQFLQSPYMLSEVIKDAHELGVVGEEGAIMLTYLTMTSRLMPDPLYLIFKGESSTGKSYLLNTVAEMAPPEDVRSYTRITPQALFWAEDPATFLKHKFLIVSERPGGEGADYSIRTMLSEKGLTMMATEKVDDKIVSRERVIEGPMAYAETTTALAVNNENETRLLEVYLDESVEHTAEIQKRQRWSFTLEGLMHEGNREALLRKHRNAQRLLRPVYVVVPFSDLLTFPTERPRTRRDQKKFLNLISVIAFARQYRKEVKQHRRGDQMVEYVEADLDDYRLSYELARTVFAVSLDELDKRSRELFDRIVAFVTSRWHQLNAQQETLDGVREPTPQELMKLPFTRRDLATHCGWDNGTISRILPTLLSMELVRTPGGRPGQTFTYYVQYLPDSSAQMAIEQVLVSPEELAQRYGKRQSEVQGQ